MHTNFSAIYRNAAGEEFPAILFFSNVTLTIRYTDQQNRQIDIYWLATQMKSFETTALDTRLHYQNMDSAFEQLIIRDDKLVEILKKQFRSYPVAGGLYHKVWGNTRNKVLIIAGSVVAFIAFLYLIFVPWLGEKMAMRFSKETEIELGNDLYNATISSQEVDTAKSDILNSFYAELNYKVGYPVRITVVHSDDINAYAIPGGHIVVNDAILEGMKTPEELAALLGHEATHIAERHSLRTLFRGTARQLFLSLLIGNNSGVVGYLVSNADELKGLQYSRSLESDADRQGILLMEKSGLNTEGMLHLIEMLQRETGGASTVPYLSTHPDFEKRISDIKAVIKEHPGASTTASPLKSLFHSIYE